MEDDFFTDVYPSLSEMLRQRNRLAVDYLELTNAQKKIIEAEDTEALKLNLLERDKLITAFDELGKKLEKPMRDYGDAKSRSEPSDTKISAAEDLILKTAAVLLKIKDADAENAAAAAALLRRSGDEIKKLAAARKGIATYSREDAALPPGFFDQRR